jgi:probable rRNA maturation factor
MNNEVTINMEGVERKPWAEGAERFILSALDKLEKHHWDLSVFFCSNTIIQKLNSQYRNLDESTDVLSFMMGEMSGERFLPGDIVISLEKAEENALKFNVSPREELHRLLIHGILHLSGMDHATNDENEPMLIFQEKLLKETEGGE